MGSRSLSLSPSPGEKVPARAGEGLPADSASFHGSGCVRLRQIFGWTIPVWAVCAAILTLLVVGGTTQAAPATNTPSVDKIPSTRDLAPFRRTVESLRGKRFLREIPAFTISEAELRRIVDRELEKEYPGRELADYEALMTWLDMLPPGTDLKAVYGDYCVGEVAGLYDSDTKEMCIPAFPAAATNAWRNPARKEVEKFSSFTDDLVLTHEFTHALEDQYWPFDDPNEKARQEATDRTTARSFLAEGSATRLMLEAIPAQAERDSPGTYPAAWNLLHSGTIEWVLDYALKGIWKSSEARVPGVPDTLARGAAMPYAYGYPFCSQLMRDWGLDGLDYICDHPSASTEQVMHPQKAWEWRDFPVQITLPKTLTSGWRQLAGDSLGEAGITVLFGCSFTNLGRGEALACGWDGDRAELYDAADGRRLLVWASSWDTTAAASRFAGAWVRQREVAHQAAVTRVSGQRFEWLQADGRAGVLVQSGRQVIIFETDRPGGLAEAPAWVQSITFTQPPEDAARAAVNHTLLRFNPLFSWRKDGDYVVSKTLWGLASRHDRNSVGAADCFALGLLGTSHRTASFNRWELGWRLLAKHQSDSRRAFDKTAVLPWGVLYSHFATKLPQDPDRSLSRASILWGLAGSQTRDTADRRTFKLLPAGLLFRSERGPTRTATHVLGTGVSKTKPTSTTSGASQFRLLGIPLWTSHS